MHSNLCLRIMSSIVFVPIVLLIVWFGKAVYEDYSIPLFQLSLAFLGAGLSWEWDTMFHHKITISGIFLTMLSSMVVFLTPDNPVFALWMVLAGVTLILWKSKGQFAFAAGAAYICLPLIALCFLYDTNGHISRELILWLIFVVWATDVGGYVVGMTLKGPKLAPKISPKKTWSGFIGAVLFAMGVAYVFALYLKAYGYVESIALNNLTRGLVLASGFLAIVSQIGDLFESMIKRRLNLKDSSNIIPGQGGLFDRVDGLIFASIAVALVVHIVGEGWFLR
ncbi:MAG: phosphatidate cytidylyltransferase [Alphaproteobacteria bacterium]|nr:phosphatidate cytidylyltransferase [Alphaproteobacteria bacterium]